MTTQDTTAVARPHNVIADDFDNAVGRAKAVIDLLGWASESDAGFSDETLKYTAYMLDGFVKDMDALFNELREQCYPQAYKSLEAGRDADEQ